MDPATDTRRLFCFPPAGAGASLFRQWQSAVPPRLHVFAVQLPGRESRIREPPPSDIHAAADAISKELVPLADRPFAFYGHSMGALIAFEVAHRVRARGGLEPDHIFVSSSDAPHVVRRKPVLHNLAEPDFLREVKRFDLLPANALACPELMQVLSPLLRADLRLYHDYTYLERGRFSCPISVIGGARDVWVRPADLALWQSHTTRPIEVVQYMGGHQINPHMAGFVVDVIRRAWYARGSVREPLAERTVR